MVPCLQYNQKDFLEKKENRLGDFLGGADGGRVL